jgi:hypothetical protein
MERLKEQFGTEDAGATIFKTDGNFVLGSGNRDSQLSYRAYLNRAPAILNEIEQGLQEAMWVRQYLRQRRHNRPLYCASDLPPFGVHNDPKAVQNLLQRYAFKGLLRLGMQLK